jgi:hypothetical protein
MATTAEISERLLQLERRLDAKVKAAPGQLDLFGGGGKGQPCGRGWISRDKTCQKSAGGANPQTASSEAGGPGSAPVEARRSRPKERVALESPITGPSGARLIGYTWQWTTEEVQDQRGEVVERRVSDWEKSIANVETGRNVVHQFEVEHQGQTRVVSAESALKLMGYTDPLDRKEFKGLQSTARTVARLRMAQHQLGELEKKWQKDWDEVELSSRPEVSVGAWRTEDWGRRREWRMGDATADQIENSNGISSEQDMYAQLNVQWKAERMSEKGWSYTGQRKTAMANKLQNERSDLAKRLQRAEAKLQAAARSDSQGPLDWLFARLDAIKRRCSTGYSCGSSCISVQKDCRKEARAGVSKERISRLQQLARGEIAPRGIGVLKPEEAMAKAKALRAEAVEQRAVTRAERERRKAEAAKTGRKPSVEVKLRRAKPGGEYGPDGHWYPGGSWMSEGAFVGAKATPQGAGQATAAGSSTSSEGATPRVVRPKEKPARLQPIEPKGEGLPRPKGLKKFAEKNDQEFFNDRGYISDGLRYGDQSLGGSLFQAAVAQRMSADELNWATDQIVRMTGIDRAELTYNLEADSSVHGSEKEALDYQRSLARNQLSGVDDERLKAAMVFMEASRYLGTTSPAQKRLQQRKRSYGEETGKPPERKQRRQGNGGRDPGYGDWIWGLNNVFRAVRIRRERGES